MTVEETRVASGADGRAAYLLPTSYGQRRLWFLDLLEPTGRVSYVEHGALRLRGPLDVAALRRAVDTLVRRHEPLRTGFAVVDGEPMQAVAASLDVPVELVDVAGLVPAGSSTARVHEALAERIRDHVRRPFDLTAAPLFRAVLFRLAADDHVFVVAFHHAIYDQWSGAVFVRELLAAYDAHLAGTEPALPELPVQYGDFAAWQRLWVGGTEEAGQLDYWARRLHGLPPLDLPTDRPRPASQTFDGATAEAYLPPDLVAALERLARERNATLFMAVLAGFAAVLSRYSGQHDLAIGTPVAGRANPELEHLLGFFVNNLVIRADTSGDPSFTDLVDRTRGGCLEAYAHAEVPFERVVERLRPARDLARSPLFSVMFVFGNVPLPAMEAAGLTAELFRVDPHTAKFDLFVTFVPDRDGGLRAVVEYNSALFDAQSADRLLRHLRMLLDGAVADPGRPLSALPMLTDAERADLVAWGTGPVRRVPETTLPAKLAQRAAEHPDRVGVRGPGSALTYADLVTRAQRVAAALRAAGVAKGQVVAVAVDRDADLPAALLGVLGCGAAYLPVDPALPAERIRFMLADSGAALVLGSDVAGSDAVGSDLSVLALADALDAEPAPLAEPAPGDVAYVIYTSGSTGQPKGVAVTHRSLANLLCTMRELPGLSARDVLAAVTTLSFDIAVLELFGPLVAGGCVDVVPREVAADGARLAAHVRACGATVMQATPTTWRLLLAAGWTPPPGFAVWCGGEAFPPDLAAALHATGATVWNLYGPTETTVWSTVYRVCGDEDVLPLGGPVANTELLVVDEALRRVPVGVPGELLIGGAGVADGYWRRAELTAERFVPHPEGGSIVYRTGDVVRWRADGELEYLGRADFQVKVRGFRIEPGEIEAVLRGQPGVADAVVVARDARLVAYVVGEDPDPAALRAACRAALPDYMVPAAFVTLDAFPLTANGKLDRAALPAPDLRRDGDGYVAPRTGVEERLAGIVAEVLDLDRVGVEDDFFALGGHSLLATGVVGRIADAFGVDLGVRAVFTHPTVAGLAEAVDAAEPGAAGDAVTAVAREPGPDGLVRLPASFQQRRVWFLAEFDPASAGAYVLHGALRLHGPLDRDALRRAVEQVAERHETLRTGLVAVDGEPVQVVHPRVAPPLSEVDLSGAEDPEAALADLVRDTAGRPFDLAAPPLLRLTLARLGTDEAALVVAVHHAIADRLAVEALTAELSAAYTALTTGAPAPLPDLPVQYGDYAAAQQRWAGSEEEAAQLAYWQDRLADLPVLDLPTDRPRPAVQSYRGATRTAELPADLVDRLGRLAAGRGATLFMALLAGYAVLLARYARADDVAVGAPVSGRRRPEFEPLIGYFTNNLVLRTDLSGDPTVADLLDRVRTTCLDAYANADVPFERIVEHLAPARDLAHSPLFQAMFITANLPAPSLRLGSAQASPLPTPVTAAKYDLTFTVFPAAADSSAQRVVAEYNTDLFEPSTVDRMLAHYSSVLESLAGAPDEPLSSLPALPADERATLVAWGTGPRPAVPEVGVPGLLAGPLAEFGGRVAVTDDAGRLTYADLAERANRLAHHLHAHGVRPGDRVALFAERSCDLMVALLGVWRAGAAYVPVDVDFPADRVAFLLSDSQAAAVLTQEALAERLPADRLDGLPVIRLDRDWLDRDWPDVARRPAAPPDAAPGPDDVAYMIYTSGSTGRPKGVPVPHRAVVNFLLAMADRPGLGPDDVVAAANTIACDMPVLDLYLPLLAGARIVMVPRDGVADGERLAARLDAAGVTVMQGTPTTWRLLQASGWRPPAGFTALAGAERVPADLARWLHDAGAAVWHLYGPTETTVWSTVYRVCGDEDVLPLGGPVANTELLVVDGELRRVPVGVPGELLIGGAGVAAGYWRRAELTAERFVPHPEGGRSPVYRTGDVVRWRADGGLEFLGRSDHQVKIRGFRVELGEIEAVLRGQPGVADAVVVARDTRLVAYVVGEAPDHAALRAVLPDYMVPAAFVSLDAFPMTANGNKVDRSKLPAPDGARPDIGGYAPPRTDVERRLAAIFGDVLGLDRVGVHDDFFVLGGHSLLATRAIARIREAFGVDVEVRTIFTNPTVGGLASALPAPAAQHAPPGTAPQVPVLFRMPQVGGELAGRYVLPASSGQRRLWFLDQLDRASAGAYTVDSAVRLTGPVDPDALDSALAAVVARHETLRTAFVELDGEPVQVVAPEVAATVRRLDLADPDALAGTLDDLSGQPFDLTRAPLLRATLVRIAEDDHVLHLALHHAIADRWSVQILARDLVAAYSAADLPPLAVQYGDYAAWQQQWSTTDAAGRQVDFWRERLAGLPSLDLPTDRPRPAVRAYTGDLRWQRIPADLVDRLAETGRRHGATLFMVTLAAAQLMLGRYSGQRDFAVGTPVAGRPRPELEDLVGFFVNNLVLRADLSGDPTVADLLDRVKRTSLDAYANADLPFDRLVEQLAPARDRARTPLFNVLFAVQNTPPAEQRMGPARAAAVDVRPGTAQFDLSLMLVPEAGSGDLRLRVEYDTELFDAATVDRMMDQYLLLLGELAADPGHRVSQLAPLTETERQLVLHDWVRTTTLPAPDPTLDAAFARQAADTPDAVAAECGDERLTYRELAERADLVARRLRAAGAGHGSRVGLLLDRSLDLPAGVLGVLRAGAAYVPLDPGWPAERMAYVLRDSGAEVLLAQSADDPVAGFTGAVVPIGGDAPAAPVVDPDGGSPDDLAYIIYTSGSTGRPKGVAVTHRNVLRLVAGARTLFDLSAGDVWSLFHSVAFDVSVFELWGAWLTGARVVVVPYLTSRDPDRLRVLLAEHRVSVLSQTPTAFRQLAAADATDTDAKLDALRYVVFAGEALDVRTLAGWLDRYGDEQPHLVNMYGTTETTVHATFHRVRAGELAPPVRNRIGRPLPDLRIHLLDGDGRPVPVGAVGEIHIGGPGVARGYAGRRELTAERFVPDPFAPADTAGRLYRTGDLARWLPDGTLDFAGRADLQVKVRGFRVEPGEIESVLREHPDVADAVVTARPGRADDTELAAYIVPRDGRAPDGADLLAAARRLLPEYFVPATLTVLDALPRTSSGKIDRAALPDPDRGAGAADGRYTEPRDDLERGLAGIWQEVLGAPRVGIHDNFFALGGHSLLATRATSRIRAALGLAAEVRMLFDRPTVAGLAEELRGGPPVDAATVPRLPREARPDGATELPASPAQRRLWLLNQLDPASAGAYIIGSAVRLTGPLDVEALRSAFDTVVTRHEPLRTCFDDHDGEPVQVIHPDLAVPFDVVDLTGADDVSLAAAGLMRERLTAPFDLATAPLVRLTLGRLVDAEPAGSEHVLLLAMHHAIGDQGSTQVIVRDVVTAYRAEVEGKASALDPLPVQYADVAAWQRDRLDGGGYADDLDYWTRHLADLPVLDLPTDRPRPPARAYRGAQRSAYVPPSVVAALGAAAREHDATPFMAALAAYQLLLSRYAGQADFGVAVPVAGRDLPESEGLVGFFAGTLVLRADLSGDPTVGDLIGRVRRTALDGYGRAQAPFEVVVERLGVARDLSRTPLAQAGFALVERVAAADREFAGVHAEPVPFDPGTAKTDLTVTLVPDDRGGWRLLAEYDTDLFGRSTVDRMLAHLRMLLTEFGTDAARPLRALPPLPDREAARLAEWGRGPVRDLPDLTWPDLFEAQVAKTPDAVAVIHGDREVSFAELNAMANRLAHDLIGAGVAAESLVAIVADRSVEMVAAVLAVHKAGGAYVPIDPANPPERIAFMLDDAGAAVVLDGERLAAAVTDVTDGTDPGNPPRRCRADNLAYVIYTSGSTGTPKGVCVEHRSVVNLYLTRYLAGLHDGSRVLQFAPFSFDVSVFEMVLSLLGGVPLVVPTPEDLAGGVEIVQLINRQRVTFTFIPPSLLAHLSPEHVPGLELLGSGGEDCPAEVAQRWGGEKRFLIGYGPTEATVYATVTDEIVGGGHPPIGRPVVNTVVRVLDADLRPRPIGAPGELYIGGAGLARGYLNRPEQTAAAFVTDPHTGERLYRTGDLVRYLPDGDLEFLGRIDDQVKIRGFRIELGEVEAAMRAAPGVAEAVAAVREDDPGDKRIVGYVVGSDAAGEDLSRTVRDAVAERLPRYMVPAFVVALPAMPLNANGKVDRRALPAPTGVAAGTSYVPPRTPTEQRLVRLVAEALGVERVGLDDDFFALGGHSLLAARLHPVVNRIWGVDLPVRVLFERSRIGALADLLDEQGTVDAAQAEAAHADALRADAVLPDEIRPAGAPRWAERPGTVLLTGATGFLGGFLAEQLAAGGATVRCLVRGDDEADAQRRLESALRRTGRWRDDFAGRVRAVPGDLAAPRLGLSATAFADLARTVDEIYHAGAVVHFLRPYAMLRAGNVGGTVEVLRLATVDRPIPVHYVSTLSVFGGIDPDRARGDGLCEDDLPDAPPPSTDTGYNHSKWVAEQVVALARARGVPVAVYRPGRIGGDSRTGVWRRDDLVCQVIRACAVTGLVPDAGLATDLVPVDHLAASIAALARRREAIGRTFQFALARKVPLAALADAFAARGWPVRLAPLSEWYAAVAAAAEAGDDLLGPVLAMYAPLAGGRVDGPGEPTVHSGNTRELLGDRLPPPEVGTDLLARYLDALVADGFLHDPREGDSDATR